MTMTNEATSELSDREQIRAANALIREARSAMQHGWLDRADTYCFTALTLLEGAGGDIPRPIPDIQGLPGDIFSDTYGDAYRDAIEDIDAALTSDDPLVENISTDDEEVLYRLNNYGDLDSHDND